MAPVLLYDGACGFCAESVQLVLRHDRRGVARFAPVQGAFGTALVARHPELQSVDSMVWVESSAGGSERVFVRSAAALRVARYLGGIWRVLVLGYVLPAAVRDRLYDFIARHRHQIMGARDTCLIVPPELRSRFLP
ncbi:MAG: thiol-disulfide oxidoreductase [Acidobacteria bacterium RIFCSPLOWO2_02_FULL_65_29]|nr:MAG: thiol-disulfide oxidoreductase [Acidobacteria bacterium RIFCSPLOWO2_02_FULL_65_29]